MRNFAGRRIGDIQRAVNSQGGVGARRIRIDGRSGGVQSTPPFTNATLQAAPLFIVFTKSAGKPQMRLTPAP